MKASFLTKLFVVCFLMVFPRAYRAVNEIEKSKNGECGCLSFLKIFITVENSRLVKKEVEEKIVHWWKFPNFMKFLIPKKRSGLVKKQLLNPSDYIYDPDRCLCFKMNVGMGVDIYSLSGEVKNFPMERFRVLASLPWVKDYVLENLSLNSIRDLVELIKDIVFFYGNDFEKTKCFYQNIATAIKYAKNFADFELIKTTPLKREDLFFILEWLNYKIEMDSFGPPTDVLENFRIYLLDKNSTELYTVQSNQLYIKPTFMMIFACGLKRLDMHTDYIEDLDHLGVMMLIKCAIRALKIRDNIFPGKVCVNRCKLIQDIYKNLWMNLELFDIEVGLYCAGCLRILLPMCTNLKNFNIGFHRCYRNDIEIATKLELIKNYLPSTHVHIELCVSRGYYSACILLQLSEFKNIRSIYLYEFIDPTEYKYKHDIFETLLPRTCKLADNLEKLKIKLSGNLSYEGQMALGRLTALRSLEIIAPVSYEAYMTRLPCIKRNFISGLMSLKLEGCEIDNFTLETFSRMNNLRRLEIICCTLSSDITWEKYFCYDNKPLNKSLQILVIKPGDINTKRLYEIWKKAPLRFGNIKVFNFQLEK